MEDGDLSFPATVSASLGTEQYFVLWLRVVGRVADMYIKWAFGVSIHVEGCSLLKPISGFLRGVITCLFFSSGASHAAAPIA